MDAADALAVAVVFGLHAATAEDVSFSGRRFALIVLRGRRADRFDRGAGDALIFEGNCVDSWGLCGIVDIVGHVGILV